MKTCLVSSVILGESTALIVTRETRYAYLFRFVQSIVYDVKESIFKSKRFDLNIIMIFLMK